MKQVVCFYIPEPLVRGYKTRNEFHKCHKKYKFISDSYYHMFNSQKRKKIRFYRVFLPILLPKTRQGRSVTYDVIDKLPCLGLSKYVLALCHKLIYEIAIFHSINRETCDKCNNYLRNCCNNCHLAHDVMCTVHFFMVYLHPPFVFQIS